MNLVGKTFGRLKVTERTRCTIKHEYYYSCVCVCGASKEVRGSHLNSGDIRSCGCFREERLVTHGAAKNGKRTTEYRIWAMMHVRCSNPKELNYQYYGGRGIKVCRRWKKFENFLVDMGNRPSSKYTLDRINVNGCYKPSNCRWATRAEQNSNRRPFKRSNQVATAFGKTLKISQWAKLYGISLNTLKGRLCRNNDLEVALA